MKLNTINLMQRYFTIESFHKITEDYYANEELIKSFRQKTVEITVQLIEERKAIEKELELLKNSKG